MSTFQGRVARKIIITIALNFLLVGLLIGGAQAQTKWDMPTPYGDGVHHTQNIRQFAEAVKKATNGTLNIVVHSGASLIKHPEIHRAVRTGQVPIGELFMGLLGNDNPIYKADNIPFLASDFASARKLWTATRPHVEKALAKEGLKLLYAVPWPPQGFYTKKPLDSIKDMAGLKLRVYSPTTSRLAILLKATPTTVQTPEIPQAFSTGIIDAMVTSPTTGVSSQAWDYVSDYTDIRAWIPKNMVIVNARAFARLGFGQQRALLVAAEEAERRGWTMAHAETKAKTATLATKGIKVSKANRRFKKALRAIGKTMSAEWAAESGATGRAILEAYR